MPGTIISAMAQKRGRITENFLATRLFLKTSWMTALGMWKMGLGLLIRGRFALKQDSIKRTDELKQMMASVDNIVIDALPKVSNHNGKETH